MQFGNASMSWMPDAAACATLQHDNMRGNYGLKEVSLATTLAEASHGNSVQSRSCTAHEQPVALAS